jgi:hypothetical protein
MSSATWCVTRNSSSAEKRTESDGRHCCGEEQLIKRYFDDASERQSRWDDGLHGVVPPETDGCEANSAPGCEYQHPLEIKRLLFALLGRHNLTYDVSDDTNDKSRGHSGLQRLGIQKVLVALPQTHQTGMTGCCGGGTTTQMLPG